MAKKNPIGGKDPFPYDGPIARADGKMPYNRYLWPMRGDSWWANNDLGPFVHSCWHFSVVALADGRFSTSGTVWDIEREHDSRGRTCVFVAREDAIRTAAARMIKAARASRKWEAFGCGGLDGKCLAQVINWARQIVARETGSPELPPVQVKEPLPARHKTGLPLFDF